MGAESEKVDEYRIKHIPHIMHWFQDIYKRDEESNIAYFSPLRLISRFKHLDEFVNQGQALRMIYETAYADDHQGAKVSPTEVFAYLNNA
jgi:hypothetical protein